MELFDGRYEKLDHLGSGAFAEVWKVRDVETGVVEALKIYASRAGIDDYSKKLFTHEFSLLANATHPNLVRPLHFAISKPEGFPYLRMKYCNNGSMKQKIGRLSEMEAWFLIRDISSALAYLYKMDPPIIHQDIKPENILKDSDKYMLSDFGISTRVRSAINHFSMMSNTLKQAGTTDYMAPERFSENKTPVMASDIWSLGVTIYEMLTMELPFAMGGLSQLQGEIVPHLEGNFSSVLKQVVEDCMILETWKRPRAEQLFEVASEVLEGQLHPELPWEKKDVQENKIPNADDQDCANTPEEDKEEWPTPLKPPVPQEDGVSKVVVLVLAIAGLAIGVIVALI